MDASRLAGIELFSDMSDENLERLAANTQIHQLPVGSVLAEQGDLATKFFVILDGTVTVHRDGGHVADLGRGDFVGEAGVVSKGQRNASVIATTDVEAAVVMAWDARELMDEFPTLGARIRSAVEQRSASD